eukprot:TRINITY_DN25785_c0_g1_i1.p1 TRINITY_DN25785_c0_g1~~TRINITY_DN25785_c0_g1_i1.p1  ORF type:complete len:106 (+),score=8.15 TRINITY_DN25785_c0_g1_i1:2-319(+)
MIRRPPRSTQSRSSAASDVYKRQLIMQIEFSPLKRKVKILCSNHFFSHILSPKNQTKKHHGSDLSLFERSRFVSVPGQQRSCKSSWSLILSFLRITRPSIKLSQF